MAIIIGHSPICDVQLLSWVTSASLSEINLSKMSKVDKRCALTTKADNALQQFNGKTKNLLLSRLTLPKVKIANMNSYHYVDFERYYISSSLDYCTYRFPYKGDKKSSTENSENRWSRE